MLTRLYLIRHGETEGGQLNRYKGHIDVPLSENGIKQMEQLSEYIRQNTEHRTQNIDNPPIPPLNKGGQRGVTSVYCSDLSRALKSAEIIAKPHKLRPIVMPELRERNFGIWEGMTFNEIKEKYPQEFDAWVSNPLKFSPVQGESTIEVRDRVLTALDKILNSFRIQGVKESSEKIKNALEPSNPQTLEPFSVENVAIVSHGGVNRVILCHFLEIPFENIFGIEQDFGALNIVEFHDNYPVVKLINFTCHPE
ncbi:MAG: histidine phosphatase family protein [Thermodesulfovibrionia bacterium]|nr:histidine phosphatase family protein [Thermodesulfovibrionia bacterium]